MDKRRWLASLGAGALLTAGVAAVPLAGAVQQDDSTQRIAFVQQDEREGADVAITGEDLDLASAAALEYLGEGRVTHTEVGDEEGYYEIEVTLENGSQVDVHLDESFAVLSDEADGREDGGAAIASLGFLPFVGSDEDEQEDEREGPDVAITGDALDLASTAALKYLGEGRVTDTEVGDEEGYYEVEVTLENGNRVDVHLNENFNVLSDEVDGQEDED